MNYSNAKQFSENWGISERRIIKLCKDGRIDGAIKSGRQWLIPENTLKPSDKRANTSKYLNTSKRILIINIEENVCKFLIPLIQSEGYQVDGLYSNLDKKSLLENVKLFSITEDERKLEETTNKYYDGIIIIDLENNNDPKKYNSLINTMAKKLYCNSPIILAKSADKNVTLKIDSKILNEIEIRSNILNIQLSKKKKYILDYDSISRDINDLLIGFKNSTGNIIHSNGVIIDFESNGKSKLLRTGEYYKLLNYYYTQLKKEDYFWIVSPMMESEWTETPLEMNFRLINIEAINRGTNIERIFLFKKEEVQRYKNNNTLKIFMQSNMNTLFVDYNTILEKEPELIKFVGSGIAGINKETLIYDLPDDGEYRAYISINKNEIDNSYQNYLRLKKYAVDLKEAFNK